MNCNKIIGLILLKMKQIKLQNKLQWYEYLMLQLLKYVLFLTLRVCYTAEYRRSMNDVIDFMKGKGDW